MKAAILYLLVSQNPQGYRGEKRAFGSDIKAQKIWGGDMHIIAHLPCLGNDMVYCFR
jgi:hypothetical protein